MERLDTALTGKCEGSRDKQQVNNNTAARQRNIVLAYLLLHGSITTLEARNELYIMGIAARIWELKHEHGFNIITQMVPVYHGGKRKIARYVLLAGEL